MTSKIEVVAEIADLAGVSRQVVNYWIMAKTIDMVSFLLLDHDRRPRSMDDEDEDEDNNNDNGEEDENDNGEEKEN
jgi:hypothetical protein